MSSHLPSVSVLGIGAVTPLGRDLAGDCADAFTPSPSGRGQG